MIAPPSPAPDRRIRLARSTVVAVAVAAIVAVAGSWTLPVAADPGRFGQDQIGRYELAEQAPADVDGADQGETGDEGGGGGIRLVSGVAGLLLVVAGVILVYRPLKRDGSNDGDRLDGDELGRDKAGGADEVGRSDGD